MLCRWSATTPPAAGSAWSGRSPPSPRRAGAIIFTSFPSNIFGWLVANIFRAGLHWCCGSRGRLTRAPTRAGRTRACSGLPTRGCSWTSWPPLPRPRGRGLTLTVLFYSYSIVSTFTCLLFDYLLRLDNRDYLLHMTITSLILCSCKVKSSYWVIKLQEHFRALFKRHLEYFAQDNGSSDRDSYQWVIWSVLIFNWWEKGSV